MNRLSRLAQLTVAVLAVNAIFYVVVTVLNGQVIVPVLVLFIVDVLIAVAIVATRALHPSGQTDDLVNASILVPMSAVGIAAAIAAGVRGYRRGSESAA